MQNRLIVILIALATYVFVGGGLVQAKPIEVISENFEFYGDTSEKSAVELVESLESYRAILFSIYNINPGPEFIPVKIYGFKSQSRMEKLTSRDNIGGLYTTTLEGPAFLLTTEGGFKKGKPASQIAYHEYTHHVLAGFSNTVYPLWYNEGFAEYLSTFEYNDRTSQFKIGMPNNNRGWALAQNKWLPYDVVLGSVRKYPFKDQGGRGTAIAQSQFYAQSWLASHYIQSTPGYPAKLKKYVDLLNKPDAPENAFEQSLGVSITDFEAELKAYHKKNRYNYMSAKLGTNIVIPKVKVRKISKAELKYHHGEALRRMIKTKDGFALAQDYYDEAEEDLGETAQILSSRALLALEDGKIEDAIIFARSALKKDPDSRHIQRTMGIIELEAYQRLGNQSGSIDSARDNLMKAMRAFPDDSTAHYYYAQSYAGGYDKPSKQAVASARSALGYYRSLEFFQTNVNLAQILERGGRGDLTIPVYKRVLVWAENPPIRAFAKQRLQSLDGGKIE